MRMEYKCKGGVALKWFGIKGNNTCDVCNHVVQNLPVTPKGDQQEQHEEELDRFDRFGEYVFPVGIVKSLAYFCLLETLMVWQSGFIVTPLSLFVSFFVSPVLGLCGSITCSSLVWSKFLWVYASAQFVCVLLSSLFFIKTFHYPAALVVCFSAFVGWGISICCGMIIDCVAKTKARKFQDSNQPRVSIV